MAGFGNYGNFGTYGSGGSFSYPTGFQPQQMQPQLKTNKIFVTSLEDALNRYAEPNTIMVYRHQDEKFEYEIMTDVQGKKTYKTLVLADYSTIEPRNTNTPTNTLDERLNAIQGRLEALEGKLTDLETKIEKKEEIRND